MSMVEDFNLPFVFLSIEVNNNISSFLMIGWDNSNLKELLSSGFEKILGFEPKDISSDITSSSLIGSIGGFVTWAKHCLKYEYSPLS